MTIDSHSVLKAAADASGLRTVRMDCLWHVADAAPNLARSDLARQDKNKQISLPVPPDTGPFAGGPFFRPPGSHRAFYHCGAIEDLGAGSATIAIKGMEAMLQTAQSIDPLLMPCYSAHNIAEHLILEEGKIPGALTTSEALAEANRAADVQSAHLACYGKVAALPLPICVLRHSDDVVAGLIRLLAGRLSAPARARMTELAHGGCAVFVYRYPVPPLRADDLASVLQGRGFRERMLGLVSLVEPKSLIERWIGLFTRLLALGYLAGSLADTKTGIACASQNACLDGGFADVGSLTPIDDLADDLALYAALDTCTRAMIDTIYCVMTGHEDRYGRSDGPGRFDRWAVSQYTIARLREALEEEVNSAMPVHPNVLQFFRAPKHLDEIWSMLGTYNPVMSPEFRKASRDHAADWMKLLRLATSDAQVRPDDP